MAELNNASVEIARRKAMADEQVRKAEFDAQPGSDKQHFSNVPQRNKPGAAMIHPTRMKLAEYERQDWIVNAEMIHTAEDILLPGYWAHMAAQMNPYDHIEVRSEDGSWIAELIVVEVDRTWAKVLLTRKYDLLPMDAMPNAEPLHKVEWKGPQHRFCVIRLSDGERVHAECKTKDEAIAWMRDHERVIQQ